MDIQLDTAKGKTLSVFTLVMINVIAIDNLRSLTAGAVYGFSLVFFYILAALLFFIPTILVTAELATGWPNTGGVYIWVREAFGPRWGFLTIWLQWIYNVVWYPTIFSFIAGILAYLIYPSLVDNKYFMIGVILCAFWSTTLVNCFGLKISSWVSITGAAIGTIFPMVFISILSFFWIYAGHPSQIHFTLRDFFPNMGHLQNIAFLTNILFGLMGMEMSAVHAGVVQNPRRNYPRALFFSAIIILMTLVFSCLAMTIVVPVQQLSLVSGFIDAFGIFFKAYHLDWFIPIIAVLIIVGGLSGATAWILGPARGLLIATEDSYLPRFLSKQNKQEMPVGILLIQGIIVTLISIIFLIMPTVNSSYWVLSNLTAQLALLFYILFFAAAIRLRYKHAHIERAYQIPGGAVGIWLVCGVGILTCMGAIILGFLPPARIAVGGIFRYEMILIFGMLACCLLPFFSIVPNQMACFMLSKKEVVNRLSTLELFRESLKFSAAHFTVFSGTDRENLHGHDYGIHASLTTLIEDEGLSFDYRFYEEKLYALCRQLDKAVLIAGLCKYLRVSEESDYCCVYFNGEKLMFLRRDVKVLPIHNVTVEELSHWFLQKLLLDREQLDSHRIQKVEIKVLAGLGRSGSATWVK